MMGGFGPAAGLFLLASCLFSSIGRVEARQAAATTMFEPIRPADLDRALMRGAGCAWMMTRGGPIRFVAIDDRAMVRLRGRLRMLRPAAAATTMFPYTHDRWVGHGIAVMVVRRGPVEGKGESSVQDASLIGTTGGRTSKVSGVLDCGT